MKIAEIMALCHPEVPEGKSGDWSVRRFSVSEDDERRGKMYAANPSSGGRWVPRGNYIGLYHRGSVVMSDTPGELRDHLDFLFTVEMLRGHVLINGLGLGCALAGALELGAHRVTVVEKELDVIRLVSDYFGEKYGSIFRSGGRVDIVHADALTWKPGGGMQYSAVWHDIWPNICSDNLKEMKALHRKYARRCKWQGSWCRAECERRRW